MDESSAKQKMQEVVDLVLGDVGTIRTGRATPALVQELKVQVYGGAQTLKINELSTVTSPDPQTLVIDPWDKSIIGEIKKGIEKANIGMSPNIDGEIIRISVPQITGEDREKFVKLLSKKIENGKIMLRQVRSDTQQVIRKEFEDKKMGEDEKFGQEKRLQEIIDEYNQKLEDIKKKKEDELLQV